MARGTIHAVAVSVEKLAFELSLDSLSAQRDVLKDVRARSATLLTASSIVTSFVGGRAIDTVGVNAITAAAIVAFCLTLLPAIYVVTTRAEGSFSIDGARLYARLERQTVPSSSAFSGHFAGVSQH